MKGNFATALDLLQKRFDYLHLAHITEIFGLKEWINGSVSKLRDLSDKSIAIFALSKAWARLIR